MVHETSAVVKSVRADLPGPDDRLDCAAVAKLLGCTPRWAEELAKGWHRRDLTLAWQETPPGGGKLQWFVSRKADSRLAVVRLPAPMAIEPGAVRALSEARRAGWRKRCEIYHRVDGARRAAVRAGKSATEVTRRLMGEAGFSLGTWFEWNKAYRAEGNAGLMDDRAARGKASAFEPFYAEARRLFLLPEALNVRQVHDGASVKARDEGRAIPSYRALAVYIRKAVPAPEAIWHREGPEAFQNKVEPNISRDYRPLRSNEIWNSDHHRFDVLVKVGERIDRETGEITDILMRPWLTLWQDLRSRKIMGHVVRSSDPNTDAILEALRRGCLAHGVPETVYCDNGLDFCSAALLGPERARRKRRGLGIKIDVERLEGIYAALGIKSIHAWKYHGQSKPCERLFGTLEADFGKLWPTYVGRSPDHKPERLPDMIEQGKAPALEGFSAAVGRAIAAQNARPHTGDGMNGRSSDEVFDENLGSKRTTSPEVLEVLLQPRIGPIKIGQHGVRYKGLYFGQGVLAAWFGQEVYIRIDSRDLTRVSVWDLQDRHLAEARANIRIPANADAETLRAAIAEKKRLTRDMKAGWAARSRAHEDIPDLMLRAAEEKSRIAAAAARKADDTTRPPLTITPIRSDLEQDAKAAQEARRSAKRTAADAPARPQIDWEALSESFDREHAEAVTKRAAEAAARPSILQMLADQEITPTASWMGYQSPFRKPRREGAA